MYILYFWIIDWKKTVSSYGLTIWISSTVLGFIIYIFYRRIDEKKKVYLVFERILFASSITMIVLGFVSLIIEGITSSMP